MNEREVLLMKRCLDCSTKFEPKANKKYCNPKCRIAAQKIRDKLGIRIQEKSDKWKTSVLVSKDKALSTEYKRYGKDAERRHAGNMSFDLTENEFKALAVSDCMYCGDKPSIVTHSGKYRRSSIDRLDHKQGYIYSNCIPSCWPCNRMKSVLGYEEFIERVRKISAFNKSVVLEKDKKFTNADRVANYNKTFPKYPKMIYDKGWMLGVWNIGNDYRGSGYHGSYPNSYMKRISSLFPDQKDVLHLFSGSLSKGDYTRFDINPKLKPDVVGEAENLSDYFELDSFDIIYADPPYTDSDALRYGNPMVNRNKVVKEAYKVLRKGGLLCWMDMVLPMYRKTEFKRVGEIAISRSTNHRVRAVFIFEKV